LITGVLNVTLQGGIGSLRNLIITDNSSWMKSRKFRLGAQAAQKVSTEMRIREARSEPFVVKDRRGECKFAMPWFRCLSFDNSILFFDH